MTELGEWEPSRNPWLYCISHDQKDQKLCQDLKTGLLKELDKSKKQGDLDDAREITPVWCGNVKKHFMGAIL